MLITDDWCSLFRQYDKFTKDEFADHLREAHDQFGRLFIILDRAPQHNSKIIQETLKEPDGKVYPEFHRPGCPDLNAIEEVWRQMKRAVLDIIPYVTVAGMHEDIDGWPGLSVPVLDIKKYLYRVV